VKAASPSAAWTTSRLACGNAFVVPEEPLACFLDEVIPAADEHRRTSPGTLRHRDSRVDVDYVRKRVEILVGRHDFEGLSKRLGGFTRHATLDAQVGEVGERDHDVTARIQGSVCLERLRVRVLRALVVPAHDGEVPEVDLDRGQAPTGPEPAKRIRRLLQQARRVIQPTGVVDISRHCQQS